MTREEESEVESCDLTHKAVCGVFDIDHLERFMILGKLGAQVMNLWRGIGPDPPLILDLNLF